MCPKPFSTIPLIRKNVLIRLTVYHWQPCILQSCGITKDILCSSTGSLGLHASRVVAKFSDLVIDNSLLRVAIAFLNFCEIMRFCNVTKLQNGVLLTVKSLMD